jgi:hypothetical protein
LSELVFFRSVHARRFSTYRHLDEELIQEPPGSLLGLILRGEEAPLGGVLLQDLLHGQVLAGLALELRHAHEP